MTTVYLSSTYADLAECRAAVSTVIARLGLTVVTMESYLAESASPLDRCLADVRRCDVFVAILGRCYGYVPPRHAASITELEYAAAVAAGKPCFIFMLDDEAPRPHAVEALRRRVAEDRMCHLFTDPAHLAQVAAAVLAGHLADPGHEMRRPPLDLLAHRLRDLPVDDFLPPRLDPGAARIRLASVFVEPRVRAGPSPAGPRPALEVLADPAYRLVVLLGAPGAGKSTVARYVALQLTERQPDPRLAPLHGRLPVLIDVRGHPAGVDLPPGGVEPAVVVVDGLDEVAPDRREEVVRRTAEFATRFPTTRVIVTARLPEDPALADAGFVPVTLCEFDDDQIGEFLTGWFAAVLAEGDEKARRRSTGLVREILQAPALRQLAGNPMLLTLLAVAGPHRLLPYAAEVVLDRPPATFVDAADMRELLRCLAYEIQTGGGHGIPYDRLIDVAATHLASRERAGEVIHLLRRGTLIAERGSPPAYGFVHLAFLQFFAADAILAGFCHEPAGTLDRVRALYREHGRQESWHEVLALVAARLNEAANAEIIELLDGPEQLVLAVRCLSQVRRLALVHRAAELLLRRITRLIEQGKVDAEQVERMLPSVAAIGPRWPGRRTYLDWYEQRGRWIDGALSEVAARMAGMLANPDDELPALLAHVLDSQAAVRVARAAVRGLAEVAQRDQAPGRALDELIRAARGDGRAVVRRAAVDALSPFLAVPHVRSCLESAARDERNSAVRLAALQRLAAEFGHDEELLPLLLASCGDVNAAVRAAAAHLLAERPGPGGEIEQRLFELCRRDNHGDVVEAAARPLLASARLAGRIRDLLAVRGEGATEPGVRAAAIRLLARDPGAAPLCLGLLRADPAPAVVRAAADALAGTRPAEARAILLARLAEEPDASTRAVLREILAAAP